MDVDVKYVLVVPHKPEDDRQPTIRRSTVVLICGIPSAAGRGVRLISRYLFVLQRLQLLLHLELRQEDVIGARAPTSIAASLSGPSCARSAEAADADAMDASANTSGKRQREEMAADESTETEEKEETVYMVQE